MRQVRCGAVPPIWVPRTSSGSMAMAPSAETSVTKAGPLHGRLDGLELQHGDAAAFEVAEGLSQHRTGGSCARGNCGDCREDDHKTFGRARARSAESGDH